MEFYVDKMWGIMVRYIVMLDNMNRICYILRNSAGVNKFIASKALIGFVANRVTCDYHMLIMLQST